MDWLTVLVQWLHVFFGIFWFGGTLYATFVVLPAMSRLPPLNARAMSLELQRQIARIIPLIAFATIILGFLRGTLFGPIRDTEALTSPYGLWWLVGLIGAVALVFWGQYVITPAVERMNADEEAWAESTDRPSERLAALIARVRLVATLELLGFVVILVSMVAMHAVSEG